MIVFVSENWSGGGVISYDAVLLTSDPRYELFFFDHTRTCTSLVRIRLEPKANIVVVKEEQTVALKAIARNQHHEDNELVRLPDSDSE